MKKILKAIVSLAGVLAGGTAIFRFYKNKKTAKNEPQWKENNKCCR